MDLIKFVQILIFSFILSVQDIKKREISNWVILNAITFMLVTDIVFYTNYLIWNFLSVVFMGAMFFALNRKSKIGKGDCFYAIYIALSLTFPLFCFAAIFLSCVFAGIFYIILFVVKKNNLQNYRISFIPFMSAGLVILCAVNLLLLNH